MHGALKLIIISACQAYTAVARSTAREYACQTLFAFDPCHGFFHISITVDPFTPHQTPPARLSARNQTKTTVMPWKPAPAEVRGACHRLIPYSRSPSPIPSPIPSLTVTPNERMLTSPLGGPLVTSLPRVCSSVAVVAREYMSPTSPSAWVAWSSFPTTSHVSSAPLPRKPLRGPIQGSLHRPPPCSCLPSPAPSPTSMRRCCHGRDHKPLPRICRTHPSAAANIMGVGWLVALGCAPQSLVKLEGSWRISGPPALSGLLSTRAAGLPRGIPVRKSEV